MIGQDSEDEAEAKPIVRRYNSMSELMIERNPEPYNAEPVPGALIERFLTGLRWAGSVWASAPSRLRS